MPRKVDPRIIEQEEFEPPQEENPPPNGKTDRERELEEELLRSKAEADKLAGYVYGDSGEIRHGGFVLMLAVDIAVRMCSFLLIEDGRTIQYWTTVINVAFGGVGLWMFWKALEKGWEEERHKVIPKFLLVVFGGMVAIKTLQGPNIVAPCPSAVLVCGGNPSDPTWRIVVAGGVAIASLLIAASRVLERGLEWLHLFLNHPSEAIRRLNGGAK